MGKKQIMSNYKKTMGIRIKERRKHLKLTQEATAEELGVSVKHFSEVERGISGLSVENLIRLSSLFGVSVDYIIKGEDNSDKWQGVISLLESVPQDKEYQITELIRSAVNLIKES